MSSLIEGYEYDIFVSYRQKDNKGDGWVSEFVDALRNELESTFKEEVSVYFDVNPHDGLLETHDVDASLKDKLRCLVFIPIVSRTYCDPRSFAWEHEFKAFVEQASKDQFGLKVKLARGNVASRVLPVRIHELDDEDLSLCESILGGVLRGVEFIYKEPGVNRPLRAGEDHPMDNINKTYYRDQINKVANAIKEIINGLKAASNTTDTADTTDTETSDSSPPAHKPRPGILPEGVAVKGKVAAAVKPARPHRLNLLSAFFIAAVLIFAGILLFPKLVRQNRLEKLKASGDRISVAVMPFQNMTGDITWHVWQDGIQDILITSLSNSEELVVRQAESITRLIQSNGLAGNYASLTPAVAGNISKKLDADIFVSGNMKKAGTVLRVYAQLIDSRTKEVYQSFQIEGIYNEEVIFAIADSLSLLVRDYLILSELKKELPSSSRNLVSTGSPEAFRYFIYGRNEFFKRDFHTARDWFSKAIDIDSNFVYAVNMLSIAYGNEGIYDQARKWSLKAYEKRDQMPVRQKINTERIYAGYFETPHEEIKYIKQLIRYDDHDMVAYYSLGLSYMKLRQYEKAIPELERALEINKKLGIKPDWANDYVELGTAYHKTGQYKKERKLYREAEKYFPDDSYLMFRQWVMMLTLGDSTGIRNYYDKGIAYMKSTYRAEAEIASVLAFGLSEAGIPDMAEENYRLAVSLEPENPLMLNNLAYFLIDNDLNVDEGLELVEKALELNPDDYNLLHTKGWGSYKQGSYHEAMELLQKSWDLRRELAVYNHEAYLHLEEAKKAAASQRGN
jgi:tetratricopeptide (TPR) repeat protein